MSIGILFASLALASSTQLATSETSANDGNQVEQMTCRYIATPHSFRTFRVKTCGTDVQWQAYDKMKREQDRLRMVSRAGNLTGNLGR